MAEKGWNQPRLCFWGFHQPVGTRVYQIQWNNAR